jgi:hypothetical protein
MSCHELEKMPFLQVCKNAILATERGQFVMKRSMWMCFVVFHLVSACLVSSALAWELLGEKQVDFGNDHDVIFVGEKEGKFKDIQIRVKDTPVEIHSVVVTFDNGKTFEPKLQEKLQADSQSRVIGLPGEKRIIKFISFKYESVKTSEHHQKSEGKSEIDDAIRTLERAGYKVIPPKYSGGHSGRHDKATVQVWGR